MLIPGLSSITTARLAFWRQIVWRIDRKAAALESIDDDKLRKNSLALRYEALSGKSLDDILVEAYALVREAARRTVGMKHYPVQLLGGVAIHNRSVAVMQTGEGKTLTASLPLYLHALTGKGSHLATANDYLAQRDAKLIEPVFNALGMSVGVVESETLRPNRQEAYKADITYSTAKEIGFDFLRDRLLSRQSNLEGTNFVTSMMQNSLSSSNSATDEPVQRGHNFMLVDEADSILIDEARTPLIVSSIPDEIAQAKIALYRWRLKFASNLN